MTHEITRFDLRHPGNFEFGRNRYSQEHRRMEKRRSAKVFVFSDKPESILDQLVTRRQRPHDVYRKAVEARVKQELIDGGFMQPDVKPSLRWDQYAGCSMCPCSPGFVVRGTNTGIDIYIDLRGETRTTAEATQEEEKK